MKPGIVKIKNEAYHAGEGISSSDLKQLLKSPAHYRASKLEPIEPTPQMVLGTVFHALMLEPESFEADFAVGNHKIRSGKEYDKTVADNPGKTIITVAQYDAAKAMVDSYQSQCQDNPELAQLNEGLKEMAFYWQCGETGATCKVKPDIITAGGGSIVDVKTASDASFDAFQKQMVDLQYFVSAAYYLRGVAEVLRLGVNVPHVTEAPTGFKFIVIETKEPYPVAIYKLAPKALEFGNALVDKALQVYAESVATDTWPGYSKESLEMDLPNWAYFKSSYVGGIK